MSHAACVITDELSHVRNRDIKLTGFSLLTMVVLEWVYVIANLLHLNCTIDDDADVDHTDVDVCGAQPLSDKPVVVIINRDGIKL